MDNRIKNFDGIFNFRDFGGYPTIDGRKVRQGKLYRSAHLNQISGTDQDKLSKMGIGLVVDLRHAPERARQPSLWQAPRVITDPDARGGSSEKVAPHEAFLEHNLKTADDARDYMIRSYLARPDDTAFRQIFQETLVHMASTGEGVLIHCAAGKDRTGTLCAIIQGALGVPQDIIMKDFMLTMQAVNISAMLGPAAQMYSDRYGRTIQPEAIEPMFNVEEIYLQSALNKIENIETYIRNALQISDKEKAALKAAYLEDS